MRNEGHVYGFVVSYASSCVCVCLYVCAIFDLLI